MSKKTQNSEAEFAIDPASKMADVTNCQKCSNPCIDPRILPCFHTFCLRCLEDCRSDRETGDQMPCPRCGILAIIPAEGFRENEFVKRLIRVATLSKPVGTGMLCDACRNDAKETEDVVATAFCLECRHILCETCCRVHRRYRPCRNHQLIPFGTLPKNQLETMFDLDFCDHHEMIPMEKYCEDCNMVICDICLAHSHASHQCSDIKLAKGRLRKQILDAVEELEIFSNGVLVKQEELEEIKENFMEEIQYTETAVKNCGQELRDLIDRHTRALLEDIAQIQMKGLDRLNRQRTDLDLHSAIVSSFKTYCTSLCNKGSSYDVCSPVNQIRDRVKDLKTQNRFHVQRHLPLPTSLLKKTDLKAFFQFPNVIGDVKVIDPPEIIYTAKLEFSGFSVMGVAKLKNAVYILCRPPLETVLVNFPPSSVIRVYNAETFTLNKEIRLDFLTSPFDMAASESDDCLYVTDLKQVYQMTDSGGQRFSRFLSWEWSPHTISVSKEGCVMLAKDGKQCSLERYSSKAILTDCIKLPGDVASVKHAVEGPNGNFLVLLHLVVDGSNNAVTISGRINFSELKQSGTRGIFEVNSAGNIIRRFSPRAPTYQLDDPSHVALDSNGQVFVADHAKDRLVQFDSELNMIQVIERPGMFGPKRLLYDKAKQQLWIGHSKQLPTVEDIYGCVNICKVCPYIE